MTPASAAEYAAALVRRAFDADGRRSSTAPRAASEGGSAAWRGPVDERTDGGGELAAAVAEDLGREVDLDALLAGIVDEVTRRLDADRGTLYLLDHARGEVVSRVAHLPELSEIRLKLGEGIAGWVARTGEPVTIPAGGDDPRFAARIDAATGYTTRSLLAVPVRDAGGQVVGVLQVLNKRAGVFGAADATRLAALAAEVAALLAGTSLRSQLHPAHSRPLSFRFNHIVGESEAMRAAYDRTSRAARTEATVLVRGESGSGKEAIARAVHFNSPRREAPFVKVDCAALPAQLIENELFGHERGAFTGADRASDGQVAAAEGGTLFLDEVGELDLPVQGKLLRLLQDRTYMRVGGAEARRADLRFVCATHRDLEAEVGAGRFRQDLYYRLRVVQIDVPPLRDRGAADLDRLIDHFAFEFGARHGRPGLELTAGARARLHGHPWPGNVRELENCLEAAVVLAPGEAITAADLAIGVGAHGSSAVRSASDDAFVSEVRPLREVERGYVQHVLTLCGGNRSEAARRLGIGRNTLLRKLRD